MRRAVLILSVWCASSVAAAEISYHRDVWPIFKRHCVGCHSAQKIKGGLRLDDVAAVQKGGENGPLFVPGKPDQSLLIKQISGDEPEMPVKEAPLSPAKVALLRDWVAQGAKFDAPPAALSHAVVIPAVYAFAPAVTSVALSPDGKLVAAACRSEVILISVDDNATPRRLSTECDLINQVEFSPDGLRLAAAGGSPQRFGAVTFFRIPDGKLEHTRRVGRDTLFRGGFAPDGKTIALGGADGAAHIVPVDAAAKINSIDLHSDWVLDVAYTPDGKQLVTGGRDKATKVSSVETLRLLRMVDQSADIISAVASDSLAAIAGGHARTVTGYDYKVALAGVETTGSGNGAQPVNRLAQYVRPFEAQPDAVQDLATSGDRKWLAVATRQAEVRIYQTSDRARKTVIGKLPAPINAVALDGNGTRLAIGSRDGRVQIYEVAGGKLLRALVPVPVQPTSTAAK